MHYHKSPKNRRVLALLLTGSLLFGGIPVYAGEYSNVESVSYTHLTLPTTPYV